MKIRNEMCVFFFNVRRLRLEYAKSLYIKCKIDVILPFKEKFIPLDIKFCFVSKFKKNGSLNALVTGFLENGWTDWAIFFKYSLKSKEGSYGEKNSKNCVENRKKKNLKNT